MIAVGIDIATNTGLGVLKCRGKDDWTLEYNGTLKAQHCLKDTHIIHRAENVAEQLISIVGSFILRDPNPTIVLEGYGFARHSNIEPIFTYGTMIRYILLKEDYHFIEVPPTSLKKFVAGKGNAPKDVMIKEVYKRWEFDTNDNNQADAYGLACFGLAYRGLLTMPKVNMEPIEKLKK